MVLGAVKGAARVHGSNVVHRARHSCVMRCEGAKAPQVPPMTAEQQAELEKAMQDPAVQQRMAQMQEAMKNPEVQQQMQQAQQAMANPELQKRMAELKDDPQFEEMFKEIETGGMPALMKFINDPQVLSKLGKKLEGVQMAPPPNAEPVINDLFDAARHGDLEATEDFLAVGKDASMQDDEGRTPLHYAAAHDHTRIAQVLVDGKADLEKRDSKNNTPLHYACGYGRLDLVDILLRSGANVEVENQNGNKPIDLAKLNEKNPVLADKEIVEQLSA